MLVIVGVGGDGHNFAGHNHLRDKTLVVGRAIAQRLPSDSQK
jgi:hypothetical protein